MRWLATMLILAIGLNAGQYTIMSENLPPYNYMENNKIKGIGGELVHAIIDKLKINAPVEFMPWARAYKTIMLKDNCILFSMSRTDAREKLFKWVGPLVSTPVWLYKKVSRELNIHTLQDAMRADLVIGVLNNDNTHQQLLLQGFNNLEITPKSESLYHKLVLERVDLVPGSVPAMRGVMKKIGYDPKMLQPTAKLHDQHLYIAFSLNTPDHEIIRWQKALNEIKSSGLYDELYKRYIGDI